MKENTRTGRAGLLPALLTLAWPVVLARATQSVVGFSDALMVAPLGEDALAAATTGAFNVFTLIILPMGTAFIVQSFAAQLRGGGDLAGATRYGWYGLGLAALSGVVGVCVIPTVPVLLGHLEYAPAVHDKMSRYVAIRLLSVAPAVGIEALGSWFGGMGNTRPGMAAGILAMIVNVALNYLLIEPRLGLPGYGVEGAASASVIATWLGFAALGLGFVRCGARGAGPLSVIRQLRSSELIRMLRFGVPSGVNWFLEFAAFALFINVIVGHLGTTVLAAFNVVMQINSLSFMPAFGVASAGAILVGESIGRRAHHEVWPVVRLTASVAMTWMGTVSLIYLLLAGPLISAFRPPGAAGEQLLQLGTTMLMLSAVWQLFDALGMTLSEALRAAGDTSWCMVARVLLAWLIFTPLSWLAVRWLDGGVLALMGALLLYLAAIAATLGARFASGRWRHIALTEPALTANDRDLAAEPCANDPCLKK